MSSGTQRERTEEMLSATVEQLCSESYLPRNTGAGGAVEAAAMLAEGLETIGLEPAGEIGFTQEIPRIHGRNVLGAVLGNTDRWIVLGAHYDAFGWITQGRTTTPPVWRSYWRLRNG